MNSKHFLVAQLILPLLLVLLSPCRGASAEPAKVTDFPFVVVFIDAKTEKLLGPFPYDRSILAKAIDKAADCGAKGVVLKFFIDKPKTEGGDTALARAAAKTKLLLQARLDDLETSPNSLPNRFFLPIDRATGVGTPLSGRSGWIPLPALSAAAYDLGFADCRVTDRMPIAERYGDRVVKSLYLCCLELAFDDRASVIPARSIKLHGKTVPMDDRSEIGVEYPVKDDLPHISFADFIDDSARPEVKDRIVILGYDSDRIESVDTPMGKIHLHRAFVYALMSMYRRFR